MSDIFEIIYRKRTELPAEVRELIQESKSFTVFNTVGELVDASLGGIQNQVYEVSYDIPGRGPVTEAVVHRVPNGVAVNYTESYMRRRDPETMVIADELPSDKQRFSDKYGYDFSDLRTETFEWLKSQDLACFFYFAGRDNIGVGGIAIAPANAGFFSLGLAMLQKMIAPEDLPEQFSVDSIIFVAPTFRHTHFNGKQVVVHSRSASLHEIYSYNLYPGPSAKKGLYGALLAKGEREGWITAHCSTVEVISPYDNTTTFMHEGASGGGKSEMLQHIVREPNGQILIGTNTITDEKRLINLPLFCDFRPVSDDMAMCHPSIQRKNGKLSVMDAENSWFIRVDSVHEYGDDPNLEKITAHPSRPLLFLNIQSVPGATTLIWQHVEDEPGKRCPNPRVILPREIVPGIVNRPVNVDVRSFGVRTPPSSAEQPNFGIIGLFHILPPALAWLWRLVAPRGHANPSILSSSGMQSEGVGSYWPFATGKMIDHANMLLKQVIQTPRTRYTLVPNQYIGVWKVGFKPQLLMREYLTRRGSAKLRSDQYQPARCPLLGYELNYLTIEGEKIPSRFLQVHRQSEVGEEGYDAGAEILYNFFRKELEKFHQPDLAATGKRIIDACLSDATVDDYNSIITMNYEYSFLTMKDYEETNHQSDSR